MANCQKHVNRLPNEGRVMNNGSSYQKGCA
jgi:hypothetical protein